MTTRPLSLEEVTELNATPRKVLPTGGCRRCGGERDVEAGLYCARCRPVQLATFMRSNVVMAFRGRR